MDKFKIEKFRRVFLLSTFTKAGRGNAEAYHATGSKVLF